MKTKSTKKALVLSLLSLVVCASMLVGTTFAWFTDSVTSANNIITSGNLDVELYYQNDETTDWTAVDGNTNVFKENTLWEPGHTEVVKLKVVNKGSLALKYSLGVNVASEVASVSVLGNQFKLSDYIKYGVVSGDQTYDRAGAIAAVDASAVALSNDFSAAGTLLAAAENEESASIVTMVVYMPETVGNEANYAAGAAVPTVNLGINLLATQFAYEKDSFNENYDVNAGYNAGKTNVGPYKLNVLSGGNATYDESTKTYSIDVKTVAQGGYNAAQGGKYYAGYTVNVAGYGENATVSFDKDTGEVVWKLADEERDGFITNGIHQQWTSVGISRAYRYDIDGDGVTDFTVVNDVADAGVEVANADQLKNALEAGVPAALTADITVDVADTGITVANGVTAKLDLNGHDIIGKSTSAEGVQLFSVNGKLDIVGNGTVSLTNDDFAWTESYRYTAINIRENGEVTLGKGVRVVCEAGSNTAKGYGMAYAVDIYTTGTLTVNGASLHSNYIAVRCFYGDSVVNVNSGSMITSSNKNYGIWPQSAPGAQITVATDVDYTVGDFGIYVFG